MKKNIWILNHYATTMYFDKGGRHFWFSEELMKHGYRPTVFCANTVHNSSKVIDTNNKRYLVDNSNHFNFIFVKTVEKVTGILSRIMNMFFFYRNVVGISREIADEIEKPDIILASSVHPLTLIAGLRIAKKFNIPCICEVRDLWPESIVAYGVLKKNNPIIRLLYLGEKHIYKNADAVIMTWEGGKDYIKEKKWDKKIDLNKIYYINNGLVIEKFDNQVEAYQVEDSDLDNDLIKTIVYTGSIRKVNNLGIILDTAKIIQERGNDDIKFIIYGEGDEKRFLKERLIKENIENLEFKGRVDKKYIPSILSKSYINLLHNTSTILDQYGQSQNKIFEYMASGNCIIQTYTTKYSILEKYECGLSVEKQTPKAIADAIIKACKENENCKEMGKRARKAAFNFDFSSHTLELIKIIESI